MTFIPSKSNIFDNGLSYQRTSMLNGSMKIENEIRDVEYFSLNTLNNQNLEQEFKDLSQLASQITGTSFCFISFLDEDTPSLITMHGDEPADLNSLNAACQFTLLAKNVFEVKDLTADPRFNLQESRLKYYFGTPLITKERVVIGCLSVLDEQTKELTKSQQEMFLNLSKQVITRFYHLNKIEVLTSENHILQRKNQTLAHDMRAPVGGIMSLASLAFQENEEECSELVSEYLLMIKESSRSVLDLAEQILFDVGKTTKVFESQTTLLELKQQIHSLFAPGLRNKDIDISFVLSESTASIPFAKANLQQIIGNLLSNAIKFTPNRGLIILELKLTQKTKGYELIIKVADTGPGMDDVAIQAILNGHTMRAEGVDGEVGYGLGLQIVKQLIFEKNGSFKINAQLGKGTCFTAAIPVADIK